MRVPQATEGRVASVVKRRVVCDIEADGLDDVKNIWCIVCKDIDTNEVFSFNAMDVYFKFPKFATEVCLWIGHNFISYDGKWIHRICGVAIPRHHIVDTLVLSRMLKYDIDGGHSLEAWGVRLGMAKSTHDDFTGSSVGLLERCVGDVELNHKLYQYLMKTFSKPNWTKAVKVEMEMAWSCEDMHQNGFSFNIDEAKKIYDEVQSALNDLDTQIKACFPPRTVEIRTITPVLTKNGTLHRKDFKWYDGNDYTIFEEGSSFSLFEWKEFNPASTKEMIDVLWAAGWKPVDRTKGHNKAIKDKDYDKIEDKFDRYGWMVNENNLSTLPDDAPLGAKLLVKRNLYASRFRTLTEWLDAYNPNTGKVHGRFNSIGTRTQRASHQAPNLGNIATAKTIKFNSKELRDIAIDFGRRLRSLWTASKGYVLVGTDMESAHLRIFGHLINDKEYIQSLLTGDKKLGTDPHSLNQRKLGPVCVDRDRAKTFIFSFLNGAGGPKIADIFGCSPKEALQARDAFMQAYAGLKFLKDHQIPADAARGYFIGVDGRYVVNDSEHHMIGMYLQNMESVLMKYACSMWQKILKRLGIKYRLLNWVHDEFVTECLPEDAALVSKVQNWSIAKAGKMFKLHCPMGGESKIGHNWLEVH